MYQNLRFLLNPIIGPKIFRFFDEHLSEIMTAHSDIQSNLFGFLEKYSVDICEYLVQL